MLSDDDSKNVLIVRIGCKEHDVDAETVISLMQATLSMIQAANREVCPEATIQIKVLPFAPGSFEFLFYFVQTGFFLLERTPIVASTLAICKDYLSIRKWFHGKPQPKTIEPGTIILGNVINADTVNVYQNNAVRQEFSRAFSNLQKDESIKDVGFYVGGKEKEMLVNIPVTNFDDFIEPDIAETEVTPEKKEGVTRTFVTIHTPVLAKTTVGKKRSKWKVIYDSRIINVDIQDENFRQNVDSTVYRFGVGDRLEVEIIEKKVFDTATNEFIVNPAGYVITKVWDHIPGKKQVPSKRPSQNTQKTLFDEKKKPRKK